MTLLVVLRRNSAAQFRGAKGSFLQSDALPLSYKRDAELLTATGQ